MLQKTPIKIQWHKSSKTLEIHFGNEVFHLPAEFLRVHSPSAEVMGHGPNQAVLQYGKKDVTITKLERAGNYALKLFFDDGHDSGIFTWNYLLELGKSQSDLWEKYLQALHHEGKSRDKDVSVVRLIEPH